MNTENRVKLPKAIIEQYKTAMATLHAAHEAYEALPEEERQKISLPRFMATRVDESLEDASTSGIYFERS